MSREARCNHLRSLRRADAVARKNIVRLTLPHEDVKAALAEIAKATPQVLKTSFSLRASQRIAEGHWNVKKDAACGHKCLAMLATLSAAISGQYLVVEDILTDAMIFRCQRSSVWDGITEEDVRAAVTALYEKAGAVGSSWPETKHIKGMNGHGNKKKSYAGNKKKKKEVAHDMEAVEVMGEDAAKAAMPSTKDAEVVELAGRLSKATVPDMTMVDSESEDEDPVEILGRRRRI